MATLLVLTGRYSPTPFPYIEVIETSSSTLPYKTVFAMTTFAVLCGLLSSNKASSIAILVYYGYTVVGYVVWVYLHSLSYMNAIAYTVLLVVPEAAAIMYTLNSVYEGKPIVEKISKPLVVIFATSLIRGLVWWLKLT